MTEFSSIERNDRSIGRGNADDEGSTAIPPSVKRFLGLFFIVSIATLAVSWFLFDEKLQSGISQWLESSGVSKWTYSLVVAGLLASDLLLPVPSSAILTHAGMYLGTLAGAFAGFVGLTVGSLVGFAVARWFGGSFVERKADRKDLEGLQKLTNKYGIFVVVFLRPVPILAEASVLLLGAGQMAWPGFLIWISISNFSVSFFFSAFGNWASENQIHELFALLLAILVPVLLLFVVRFIFQRQQGKIV